MKVDLKKVVGFLLTGGAVVWATKANHPQAGTMASGLFEALLAWMSS